jgi:glycine cleavage system H protein
VVERTEEAIGAPDLVNASPYDRAWLVKVRLSDPSQLASLMEAAEYDDFAGAAAH